MVLEVVDACSHIHLNLPEKVAEAIESVGGKAYIIQSDEGTKLN